MVGTIAAHGLTIRGTLYVDGAWCGGDRPPHVAEGAVPATGPTPVDARWAALEARLSAAPEALAPAAARLRDALRQGLLDVEDAERAGLEASRARDNVEAMMAAAADLLAGERMRISQDALSELRAVVEVERATTVEEVNALFMAAADGPLQGILGYETRALVSSDYTNDPRSSIIDAQSTMVINGTQVKIYAWYDNEWGYACRLADIARMVAGSM